MIAVFLSLLVKSGLIAGLALAAAWLLRGRPAAERVMLLRAAVVLLVVAPVIALTGPDLTIWLTAASAPQPAETFILPVTGGEHAAAQSSALPAWPTWLALAWSAGVAVLLARFGLGVLTLARWTRAGDVVSDPAWTAPLARLAGASAPRLLMTGRIASPLSWGVPPGVVLIGAAQLNQPRDAEAVLAHELAHIGRRDWLFLAVSRVATALFWFNPLVWLLQAELGRLSEEAADADALRHVEPEAYARTLLGLATDFTPVAATGMTGPARSLAKRITKVMTNRRPASPRPIAMTVAVGALLAVATPLAAVELSVRDRPVAPSVPAVPYAPLAPMVAIQTAVPPLPAAPPVPPAPPAPPAPPEAPEPPTLFLATGDGEEHRAAVAAARQAAAHARVAAAEARAHAAQARTMAHANADLSRQAERTAAHAGAMAEHAAHARVNAEEIQAQVARQMVDVRAQMRAGADQMVEGARTMREEARKLRDPAYRAEQIQRARERGQTVTDRELLDAIPKMENGADRMEEGAARMREQGANPG